MDGNAGCHDAKEEKMTKRIRVAAAQTVFVTVRPHARARAYADPGG